jgi:hypothetical protein
MRAACLLSALGSFPLHMMALVVALAIRDGIASVEHAGWFSASFMLGLLAGSVGLPAVGVTRVTKRSCAVAVGVVASGLAAGALVPGPAAFAGWIAVGAGCSVLNLLGTTFAAGHAHRQQVLRVRMAIVLLGAAVLILLSQVTGGFGSYASVVAVLAASIVLLCALAIGWYVPPSSVSARRAGPAPGQRRIPAAAIAVVILFFAGQPGFTAYAAHIAATHGIGIDVLPFAYAACKGAAALVLLQLSAESVRRAAPAAALSLLLAVAIAAIAFATDIVPFVLGLLAWEIATNLLSTRFQAALLARHSAFAGPWLPALIAAGAGIGPVVHGWAIGAHLGLLFVAFSIFSAFLPALWLRDPRAGTTPHGAAFSRRPSVSG